MDGKFSKYGYLDARIPVLHQVVIQNTQRCEKFVIFPNFDGVPGASLHNMQFDDYRNV